MDENSSTEQPGCWSGEMSARSGNGYHHKWVAASLWACHSWASSHRLVYDKHRLMRPSQPDRALLTLGSFVCTGLVELYWWEHTCCKHGARNDHLECRSSLDTQVYIRTVICNNCMAYCTHIVIHTYIHTYSTHIHACTYVDLITTRHKSRMHLESNNCPTDKPSAII